MLHPCLTENDFFEPRCLAELVPNSVVTDANMNVLATSPGILSMLKNATSDSLIGKNLLEFCSSRVLIELVGGKLMECPIQFHASLSTSNNKSLGVDVTGFCVRANGREPMIVFQLNSIEELTKLRKKVKRAIRQRDLLLESGWHDLRGPIATIRGIIDLLTTRKNDDELNVFIQLVGDQAEKLDQRLRNLLSRLSTGDDFDDGL